MRIGLALNRRPLLLGLLFGVLLLLTAGTAAAAASSWQAPLPPATATRHFERPPTPYPAGHRGVDLAGVPGEAVLAAGSGCHRLRGTACRARCGGHRPRTAAHHVRARSGDRSPRTAGRQGQQIGRLQPGHPGCPAAACLHWGLLRGDTYLDPLSLLGEQWIRLLPRDGGCIPRPGPPGPGAVGGRVAWPPSGPGVTWSVAALAGAGVVMVRRRR